MKSPRVLTDVGKNTLSTRNNNTAKTTTKKTRLLANPDIRRWYDNPARGSKITAECRLRKLGRFYELHDLTPMELASLAMRDLRTTTDLLDHVAMLESQGYLLVTVDDQLKTVKSWLRHFDVEIRHKMKVTSNNFTPTSELTCSECCRCE